MSIHEVHEVESPGRQSLPRSGQSCTGQGWVFRAHGPVSLIDMLRSIPVCAAAEAGELNYMIMGEFLPGKALAGQPCPLWCNRWLCAAINADAEIFVSKEPVQFV
jgi:hypothetical protein